MPNGCRRMPACATSLALRVFDPVRDDDRVAVAVAFDERLDMAHLAAVRHEKFALLDGPAAADARVGLARHTTVASARAAFTTSARGVSAIGTEEHAGGVRVAGDFVVLEGAPRARQQEV